jgi:hypothetical protein
LGVAAVWRICLWIIGLHGQTMVEQEFQKPVYETCGSGSSHPIGFFIFYYFNIFCQAEAQNHPSAKILAKKLLLPSTIDFGWFLVEPWFFQPLQSYVVNINNRG